MPTAACPTLVSITLAPSSDSVRLREFIERQSCLREQRGRIMTRDRCRNGWLGFLNARLTRAVPLVGGQRLEITADIFNLPNLMSPRWGRYRDVTTSPSVQLLQLVGWDAVHARGVYRFTSPPRGVVDDVASRWRMQLGARYAF